MARSEYSRLRGIAQKRIQRLEEAGLATPGISLPKSKDLTPALKERYTQELMRFISQDTTLRGARKAPGTLVVVGKSGLPEQVTEVELKARERRERKNRRARERRELLSELSEKDQRLIRNASKIGKIRNEDIETFIEYVKTRSSQEKAMVFYDVIDDFSKLISAGHKPSEILNDFERFKKDKEEVLTEAQDSEQTGYDSNKFNKELWKQFVKAETDKKKKKGKGYVCVMARY